MAGMLWLSDQECKTIMIKILKPLMDKIYKMQEWMGNVSKEMEIPWTNPKNARDKKNNMKNAFVLLISRLDTAEEKNLWTWG